MDIQYLYESLKGTRAVNGELLITDFTDADYEELYYTLLRELAPYMEGNFEAWYMTWANKLYKEKKRKAHKFEFYCAQVEKEVFAQTIREQLTTIKYFLQRRASSRYKAKVEEGNNV